jgi:hypothetical protein
MYIGFSFIWIIILMEDNYLYDMVMVRDRVKLRNFIIIALWEKSYNIVPVTFLIIVLFWIISHLNASEEWMYETTQINISRHISNCCYTCHKEVGWSGGTAPLLLNLHTRLR